MIYLSGMDSETWVAFFFSFFFFGITRHTNVFFFISQLARPWFSVKLRTRITIYKTAAVLDLDLLARRFFNCLFELEGGTVKSFDTETGDDKKRKDKKKWTWIDDNNQLLFFFFYKFNRCVSVWWDAWRQLELPLPFLFFSSTHPNGWDGGMATSFWRAWERKTFLCFD